MLDVLRVVRLLADPARQEELLGDLEELRRHRGTLRLWYDGLSVCLRQSRFRTSPLRIATLLVAMGAALLSPAPGSTRRTISAVDNLGSFTLDFDGPRIIGATLDGVPLAQDRLVQTDGRLVIVGGDRGRDLHIRLRPDGSIYWQGRDPNTPSQP